MTAPGAAAGCYQNAEYWDQRYHTGPGGTPKHFDWFFNYSALRQLFRQYLRPDARVLHVGCGNSNIQEGMALDGFSVTNVDISPVVIEQMKLQHSQLASLDYLVADCRDMSGLPAGGFGSCIDKGTLDAVLCSASGQLDAARYMREICRLLQPGGVFLLISLGAPSARLSLLQKLGLWQEVEVLLLPKPLLYLQSDAAMSGRPPPAATAPSKDAPVKALGPWPAATVLAELAARRDSAGAGGGGNCCSGSDEGSPSGASDQGGSTGGGGHGPDGSPGSGGLDERDYFYAYVCTTRQAQDLGPVLGAEAGGTPATAGTGGGTGAAAAAAAGVAKVAVTIAPVEAELGAEAEPGTAAAAGAAGCQRALHSEVGPPGLDPEPALVGGECGGTAGATGPASLSEPLPVLLLPADADEAGPGQPECGPATMAFALETPVQGGAWVPGSGDAVQQPGDSGVQLELQALRLT